MKRLFLIVTLFFSISIVAQINKVEPPFWWVDMDHHQLELMIYGENISQYKPSIENITIQITGVTRTENENYIFLNLDVSNAISGTFKINFSKKGKKNNFSIDYELKERQEGSKLRKGFDSSDIVYLIMPDRFANGNPENDSHPDLTDKLNRSDKGGRHGGDIKGIVDNLDYLEKLGVTAIWNTPMLEDNDARYSYHTYAQSDVYKIDPRYGTNRDYKNLASELHKRDMKLIMDYVTNHWGAEHWMIKDLPTYSWINQFPGYANSNYRMTTQYDTNASEIDTKYCMDGWFVKTMPDLNQRNPLVLNYLIQNAIWWIEYAGLDGLRVDTYSYGDKEAIAKWTKSITDEYPNFNIVGEAWLYSSAAISYWQKDSKIAAIQNYNTYLPSVMDFTLQEVLTSVFNEKSTWNKGIIRAYENFTNDFMYPNINSVFVFAENHDTQRINHLYNGDPDKYKLAMTLISTTRGIPQVYYGSEIGMLGNKDEGDGDIRRDFPGGWEGDPKNAFTKAGRNEKQQDLFEYTSKLFNWRKNTEVIHTGKLKHYIPENNVYVYFRYNKEKSVMVVINNNPENQTISLKRFKESLNGISEGKDILTDTIFDFTKPEIHVLGKKALVIELN
jgi:neopullulanase